MVRAGRLLRPGLEYLNPTYPTPSTKMRFSFALAVVQVAVDDRYYLGAAGGIGAPVEVVVDGGLVFGGVEPSGGVGFVGDSFGG